VRFEDVLARAQWYVTADGRPVVLSLAGAADDGAEKEEEKGGRL